MHLTPGLGGKRGNPQWIAWKPMDRGACKASVHRVAQVTQLKQLSMHALTHARMHALFIIIFTATNGN